MSSSKNTAPSTSSSTPESPEQPQQYENEKFTIYKESVRFCAPVLRYLGWFCLCASLVFYLFIGSVEHALMTAIYAFLCFYTYFHLKSLVVQANASESLENLEAHALWQRQIYTEAIEAAEAQASEYRRRSSCSSYGQHDDGEDELLGYRTKNFLDHIH